MTAENTLDLTKSGTPRKPGMFKAGQSGNLSGRPKESYRISELAKEHTELALSTLVEVARNKKAPHSARVNAACALLDRAWGKPAIYVQSQHMSLNYSDLLSAIGENEQEYRHVVAAESVKVIEDQDKPLSWEDVLGYKPAESVGSANVPGSDACQAEETKGEQQ